MFTKDVGKGNLPSNGRERSIQYFRNLASLTDGRIAFQAPCSLSPQGKNLR